MSSVMDDIQIDFRKWDGQRHWQFVMHKLGVDDHGIWLWSPAGSPMQRGDEPIKKSKSINIKLVPDNKWWTAIWSNQQRIELYVDIITPPSWNGSTVTMVDIDLDVARMSDGTVEVLDEDEFEESRIKYDYPERLVDTARATTARIAMAVEAHHEPFGRVGGLWLEKALSLADQHHE